MGRWELPRPLTPPGPGKARQTSIVQHNYQYWAPRSVSGTRDWHWPPYRNRSPTPASPLEADIRTKDW
eukprot:14106594-Alexandrium_andersonii.AAC.1